jgi:hypothetical protein
MKIKVRVSKKQKVRKTIHTCFKYHCKGIDLRHPNLRAQQKMVKSHSAIHKRPKKPQAPSHKKHK